jgi:hypothetical protein
MIYGLLADLLAFVHLLFVLFVSFGAFFALRWPRAVWMHAPALMWGLTVEFGGLVCPLTPLENWLLMRAGKAGYQGDFLSRWLLMVLYPDSLTPDSQLMLGGLVMALNAAIYAWIWRKRLGWTRFAK